jgi:hypothetical protein
MGPNDLQRAFDAAGDKKDAMELLTKRTEIILGLFQVGMNNFMADPGRFDPKFDVKRVGLLPKGQQDAYFKRVAQCLLVAATQGVLVGEDFHTKQYILASKKVMTKVSVKIEGVEMPDLGPSVPDLDALCVCGHSYGKHTGEVEGFCMNMDCTCRKFTPANTGEQPHD